MSQLTEIRWHARAGQGAVTAAKLVAINGTAAGQLHPGYARIWPGAYGSTPEGVYACIQ